MGFGAFSNDTTDIADKIDVYSFFNHNVFQSFVALAPVATVGYQESIVLTFLADLDTAEILYLFGEEEFLPSSNILIFSIKY
jgi:hypothetical protein